MPMLKIPKVIKQKAEGQAADAIREAIMDGVILPGARITEVQLAAEMSLSRATIRTALHQLQKEGLTTLIPYTGWTVISLTAKDAWELYTIRSSIERLAARMVAYSINEAKRSAISASLERLISISKTGNTQVIADAYFALHNTIVSQAHHGRLLSQYESVEQQVRLCIRSTSSFMHDVSALLEQQSFIVEAILNGDIDEAGNLAETHNLSEGNTPNTLAASSYANGTRLQAWLAYVWLATGSEVVDWMFKGTLAVRFRLRNCMKRPRNWTA